jgi:FixJ family two-component response regulator
MGKRAHTGAGPACVILDLKMPGPSGLDLQQGLARRGDPLPIVFLTGQADVPSTVQALRAGASDFLEKPAKREVVGSLADLVRVAGRLHQGAGATPPKSD